MEEQRAQAQVQAQEQDEFVSWVELCGEEPERDHKEIVLDRYGGKKIRYRTRVPLDMLIRAQKRFLFGKKRDMQGFFVHLLRYLLLKPRIENDAQAKQALKADGRVMMEIINGAVGDISGLQEEADEEGEV